MNTKNLAPEDLDFGESKAEVIYKFLLPETYSRAKQPQDDHLFAIDWIRQGIPKIAVETLLEKTNVSRAQLSQIIHISLRQLNRYQNDDLLSVEQSNFLYEFTRIYTRGLDIFGDGKTLDKWLMRSNLALGDQSPITLLDTSEGIRMVDDLLSQIEYGFYS